MIKIPEADAMALMATKKYCHDCPDWRIQQCLPSAAITDCGLTDEQGARTQLFIELIFNHSQKTKITTIKFTLFKNEMSSRIRVYQLHIKKLPKLSNHDLPHEHVGAARHDGLYEWVNWGYDNALQRFCDQTNIEFVPPVLHPSHFELKP